MAEITRILTQAAGGDRDAARQLLLLAYQDLRDLAEAKMRREPAGQTLQPTALVHEAYLRLFGDQPQCWENRAHFFAAAAESMRRILVERARRQRQLKRGGGRRRVPLSDQLSNPARLEEPLDVMAVDEALDTLEAFDPRMAQIVKLRCFVGMTVAETAEAMGLSSRSVNREWLVARAWLAGQFGVHAKEP